MTELEFIGNSENFEKVAEEAHSSEHFGTTVRDSRSLSVVLLTKDIHASHYTYYSVNTAIRNLVEKAQELGVFLNLFTFNKLKEIGIDLTEVLT